MSEEQSEAHRILDLCSGDRLRAFEIVQNQLGVLVLRTQVMLSLSGIVITVTGFSGKAIAQTGIFARVTVIAGLSLVLCAAAVAVGGVLKLKWLTQTLTDDVAATLTRAIEIRNRKSRFLSTALTFFIIGFSMYCLAVAQLLAAP